jgi:hypothetical protein
LLPRGPREANAACDGVQSALQINDFDEANSLIHNWINILGLYYPRIQVRPSQLLPSEADFDTDIHQTAANLCKEVRAAFSLNDPTSGYVEGVRLSNVLERLVADLPASPQAKFDRMERPSPSLVGFPRFYRLVELAKAAFNANDFVKAKAYGNELLRTAQLYPNNWNHGNAIYFGDWMLGRVALHEPPRKSVGFWVKRVLGAPQLRMAIRSGLEHTC